MHRPSAPFVPRLSSLSPRPSSFVLRLATLFPRPSSIVLRPSSLVISPCAGKAFLCPQNLIHNFMRGKISREPAFPRETKTTCLSAPHLRRDAERQPACLCRQVIVRNQYALYGVPIFELE